ncbi:MAG: hypothetical protein ABFS17_07800 [Chloroflexota bacterium]
MGEEFESTESTERMERSGESQEMGELNQMTHEPGEHLEANRAVEDAEQLEAAFNAVVAAEADVLPIPVPTPVPGPAEESGEAEVIPLPLPTPVPGPAAESGEADTLPVPIPGPAGEGGEADGLPVPIPGGGKEIAEEPDDGPNPFSETIDQAARPNPSGDGTVVGGPGSSGAEGVGATPINLPRLADQFEGEETPVQFDGESFQVSEDLLQIKFGSEESEIK